MEPIRADEIVCRPQLSAVSETIESQPLSRARLEGSRQAQLQPKT